MLALLDRGGCGGENDSMVGSSGMDNGSAMMRKCKLLGLNTFFKIGATTLRAGERRERSTTSKISVLLSKRFLCVTAMVSMLMAIAVWGVAEELRTWKDATGNHTIEAELISFDEESVVLRNSDGIDLTVAVKKLSNNDQEYVAQQKAKSKKSPPKSKQAPIVSSDEAKTLREMAELFYSDLRNPDRTDARGMLTSEAQTIFDDNKSFLSPASET